MTNISAGGPRKAALLILGLSEDVATLVLKNLDERDLTRLAQQTEAITAVPMDELEPVLEDFERTMQMPAVGRAGGDYVRRLAASALGEERAKRLFQVSTRDLPGMETIRAARTSTLAEMLLEEPPQIAAVILSQLPEEQAARILLEIPADKQVDLMVRISMLKEVPHHAVLVASESLAKALSAAGALSGDGDRQEFNGVSFAAGLLNELPPADTERLLGSLQEKHEKLAPKIREAMFTFEDLGRVEVRQLQMLMREVSSEQLLIAMKTASEPLRERFLSAVSSRAASAMRDDLAVMPPTRLADVETAQREIVEAAMRLSAEGRITLPGAKGEKLV